MCPPGLLGDPVNHRQSEAGALPLLLRGEERVEDPFADRPRNARTGVADDENDVFAVRNGRVEGDVAGVGGEMPHVHGEGSAVRHRVPRVHGQVEHDLAELAGVGVNPPGLGGEIRARCGVPLPRLE